MEGVHELRVSYDRDADVLYVSLHGTRPGLGTEVEDGVIARYDPDSGELVGVTVVGLSERTEPVSLKIAGTLQLPGAPLTEAL